MTTIEIITDESSTLTFRLKPVHVSIANSLRRVLLSEISTVIVKSYPHDENQCHITINNTRFTNEMIKQRISSIPIHIHEEAEQEYEGKQEEDEEVPAVQPIWQTYLIKCKKINTSDQMVFVTTEDLELVHKITGEKMGKPQRDQIFPPDEHGYYIDILRLRPQLAETIPGEEIELTCDMSISNAKDDSMYNVVSKATYENTIDTVKANEAWSQIEKDTTDTKENWFLLDAKRYFIPNSFDFTIETVGVYTNKRLLYLAIQKMIDKLTNIMQNTDSPIKESLSTINHCYDITLQNEGYTLGKVLEYLLYSMYFEGESAILTYLGFKKEHPHDDDSIIRIAFKEATDKDMVREKIINAAAQGILEYNSIAGQIQSL
jgi:DNA-directed RNA polymerase subunit L